MDNNFDALTVAARTNVGIIDSRAKRDDIFLEAATYRAFRNNEENKNLVGPGLFDAKSSKPQAVASKWYMWHGKQF